MPYRSNEDLKCLSTAFRGGYSTTCFGCKILPLNCCHRECSCTGVVFFLAYWCHSCQSVTPTHVSVWMLGAWPRLPHLIITQELLISQALALLWLGPWEIRREDTRQSWNHAQSLAFRHTY